MASETLHGQGQLADAIQHLEIWGVTDVMLPFLLVFTIVYAILYKANILGQEKKNLSMVVALVMAATVVVLHVTGGYPQDYDVVDIMNAAIPNVLLFLIAGMSLLLLVGIFGGSPKTQNLSFFLTLSVLYLYLVIFVNSRYPDISIWVPLISLLIIIVYVTKKKKDTKEAGITIAGGIAVISFGCTLYFFGHEAGWFEELPWWLENQAAVYFILVISIITAVVAFVLRGDDDDYRSSSD